MKSRTEYQNRKDDALYNGAMVANSLRENLQDEYFPMLNIRECAKQWKRMKKHRHFYKKHMCVFENKKYTLNQLSIELSKRYGLRISTPPTLEARRLKDIELCREMVMGQAKGA